MMMEIKKEELKRLIETDMAPAALKKSAMERMAREEDCGQLRDSNMDLRRALLKMKSVAALKVLATQSHYEQKVSGSGLW